MNRRGKRILVALFTVLLSFSLLAGYASAAAGTGAQADVARIPLYVEGIRAGSGLMINNITYVPLRSFCEAIMSDVTVSWDAGTQTATADMAGLEIVAQVGTPYVEANGRYFYTPSGVIMRDGDLCVPLDAAAKAFTADVMWNAEYQIIDIGLDHMAPATPADQYYNSDDLYWLSHVINAEAGNQPLTGKIGVGDVVINRVNSPKWQDSIHDVIFAPGQFSVVPSGAINLSPNDESILAAKLCLDGASTVGKALYFVNPTIADTSWLDPSTLIITIGQHNFYA
ncbi:MAG: cell wall hydrolase [Defluviitaleaceae bacterium]|nr:cell wall hydrolase [Defluviitaleaceae bacterium]